MNITKARNNLIESQVRPWGGINYDANNALKNTPREDFVPDKYKKLAFADIEIPLNAKAKMFNPKIEGRILAELDIKSNQTVLEIGTGSGYLTAVIAKLAKSVVTIEIDEDLSKQAQEKTDKLNLNNITYKVADATKDLDINDFFDIIIVGSAMPQINQNYLYLLNTNGKMFVVEGEYNAMSAKLITRISKDKWQYKSLFETNINTMQGLAKKASFKF
jgi:protein-L-isoaspartate(D-aspartate) O-methyltransferase